MVSLHSFLTDRTNSMYKYRKRHWQKTITASPQNQHKLTANKSHDGCFATFQHLSFYRSDTNLFGVLCFLFFVFKGSIVVVFIVHMVWCWWVGGLVGTVVPLCCLVGLGGNGNRDDVVGKERAVKTLRLFVLANWCRSGTWGVFDQFNFDLYKLFIRSKRKQTGGSQRVWRCIF